MTKDKSRSKDKSSSKKIKKDRTVSQIVMDDKEVHRLAALVTSDFEMKEDDVDYQITHQQLIKVCKILKSF